MVHRALDAWRLIGLRSHHLRDGLPQDARRRVPPDSRTLPEEGDRGISKMLIVRRIH
jgi:hypothetical protein